jgi:alkylation response protein AidB-like acyl-CoA dehydrogenase
MTLQVLDRAIQAHGAEGISQDTPLAHLWAGVRTLRFADVRSLPFLSFRREVGLSCFGFALGSR